MRSYSPVDQGGYKEELSAYDTYHCWAATQYREKVRRSHCGLSIVQHVPVRCSLSGQIMVTIPTSSGCSGQRDVHSWSPFFCPRSPKVPCGYADGNGDHPQEGLPISCVVLQFSSRDSRPQCHPKDGQRILFRISWSCKCFSPC